VKQIFIASMWIVPFSELPISLRFSTVDCAGWLHYLSRFGGGTNSGRPSTVSNFLNLSLTNATP
jgi:hypothetical protein